LQQRQRLALVLFFAAALACRFSLADAYDPPATYYDYATGNTGTTLKQHLHAIIDAVDDSAISNTVEHIATSMSYDSARSSLQVTDADTAHSGHIITVYDRTSLDVSSFNTSGIPGWDGGTTWNREHTWPRSRGIGSSGPDDSDLFELRPALTANNGDRGDLNFGGAFGQAWGSVTDGGQSYWYPGDADAGMIARQEFYMAVRYDGSDANTQDLEIGTGNVANPSGSEDLPPQLGNLTRLLEWHFAAAPDSFERRRNQVIFDNYQHNRNSFTDHPEYVWSVFKDQLNDSQISIAGSTVNSDGSSSKTVNLGKVIVGGAVPAGQAVTINKTGLAGTYYSVTANSPATSSITGPFNAFRILSSPATDTKSITVGLSTSTASAGPQSGTVTIDNLDVTTGYDPVGTFGHGGKDGNDGITVNLNVLDHARPSFASPTQTTSLTLDFGNVAYGGSSPTLNFAVFDLNAMVGFTAGLDLDSIAPSGNTAAFTTNLAPFSSIAAGTSNAFTASLNLTNLGTFLATYSLNLSDENLAGAQNTAPMTLTLKGVVRLAGDYNGDGVVNSGDYLVWRRTDGQTGVTAYSGADGDGNGTINNADFNVWRLHFGQTAPGSGAELSSAAIPEPAVGSLVALAIFILSSVMNRRSPRT
jgi:endonuclease I